jgi:hypothetical protein
VVVALLPSLGSLLRIVAAYNIKKPISSIVGLFVVSDDINDALIGSENQ